MRALLGVFAALVTAGCSCDDDSSAASGADASSGAGGVGGGGSGGGAGAPTDAALEAEALNLVDGSATAQCGPTAWSVRLGGSSPDSSLAEEAARAVLTGPGGEVFVTGFYRGDTDFGGGPRVAGGSNPSMFVLELDASGQHVWSQGYGDPSAGLFFTPQARGTALTRSADGSLYVAGSFAGILDFGGGSLASTSELSDLGDAGLEDAGLGDAGLGGCLLTCAPDAVVLKLDAAHAHKWSKRYGGKEGDAASGIAVDSAGNVLVTGVFRATADFDGTSLTAEGADQRDVFLVKTDADGNLIRALDFGGAGDDLGYGVATHGTDVVVVGSFTDSIDFGRGAVPSGGTEFQAFVAKLDENGQEVWSRSLPATIHSVASGVAVDSAGNVFVAGLYRGALNLGSETLSGDFDEAFVVKLDPAGNVLWGRSYGAYENDGASAVAVGPSDEVTVVGSVSHYPVDFGGGALRGGIFDDLFAVTLDAQGTHLCSRRYATSDGSSAAYGITVDATGRVLVAGSFNGSVDFGKGTLVSTGGSDGVVLALEGSAR